MDRSPAVIIEYFNLHHAPLYRFAWRLTGSLADAEDIVQECFLALLRPECAFDPARTPLRTYLFGAVHKLALRRMQQRPPLTIPANPSNPERECYTAELAQAVAHAIGRLPDGQREVLLLAHYEQMPLADIAAVLDLEIGAVKSRLQRARATMRTALADYAPNLEKQP